MGKKTAKAKIISDPPTDKQEKSSETPIGNPEKPKGKSKKPKAISEISEPQKLPTPKAIDRPEKTTQSFKGSKPEKPVQDSPEDAHGLQGDEAVLFEYLLGQNRPYSALNIHDNLHGAVKKASCQKLLDKLVDCGKLQAKEFGKVKIYLVNQKLIPTITEAELNQLDNEIKQLSEELETAKAQVKELNAQVKELENAMSTEEIEKAIIEETKVFNELQEEINSLQQQGCVSEEMRKAIENKMKSAQTEEKKRFKIYHGLITGIADMLDEPLKKVKELIGIEE